MVQLGAELSGKTLTIKIGGRIDTLNIDEIHNEIMEALEKYQPVSLVVDLADLQYISSIGLREILQLQRKYDDFKVINVSDSVYEVFDITRFVDIIHVERAYKEVSIENCPVLGKGACGTVYKLDNERIVKIFEKGYEFEKIIKERDNARNAFTHGIDTAIPFDIVKCGEDLGLVYEIINADTLKNKMTAERDRLGYYMGIYAGYIKHMHSVVFDHPCYPSLKDVWAEKTDALQGIYSDEEKERVKKAIYELPDRNTFVHGDINFGNLMIEEGKTVMIDMEDAMLGHPVYDIAFLYYILKLLPPMLPEDIYGSMIGFTPGEAAVLWKEFTKVYFDAETDEKSRDHEAGIHPYGLIRLLDGVPSCFLIFDSYDDKTREKAVSMYEPAARKCKEELMAALSKGISRLTF